MNYLIKMEELFLMAKIDKVNFWFALEIVKYVRLHKNAWNVEMDFI